MAAYPLCLAQNLMSKIVKERPEDPIEFLIGKLQVIQRQKKKVTNLHSPPDFLCWAYTSIPLQSESPAHSASLAFGARSKMQVTGKSVTPKTTASAKGA